MIAGAKHPSVHWRMVLLALVVTAMAVVVVLVGITLFDVQQYRARAREDAASLAGIIGDNSMGALAFADTTAAAAILASASLQRNVTRACLYAADGTLVAGYARDAGMDCTVSVPVAPPRYHTGATQSVQRGGDQLGYAYVEEDLSGEAERVGLLAGAGLVMLLVAVALAFLLAQRLARGVSGPISRLAEEARRIGRDGDYSMPEMVAPDDEVGDLVHSFQAMMGRVREANHGLVREIEQRKAIEAEREMLLEREREASRMKDEFVAMVSHELRTPIGAILGWTQVMQATKLDEATLSKALQAITRSAEAQARVIEDLVDISRITAGKLRLAIEVLDLRVPVGAALDVARRDAELRGLRIDTELPPQPALVRGDADRLRQVVANLLSNSVKFTRRGGCINVAVREVGPVWEIVVSDDGVGIDPVVLPYIFDRYRQADSSTARRFEGLGLGLSIVKEVTELHGGTVSAESAGPDQGATFRVRLPRHAEALAPLAPSVAQSPPGRLDGVRVLAVDDNADALEIMSTALTAVGASVRTARSGSEAIRQWDHEPPDVLLCDLAMPGMDGFDVLARVRALDAQTHRSTPAIAVTAHATPEHRRRSADAGFSAHVTKPYRLPELVRAVKDVLE
ncbi:MAG: ATP-binding protein [Gemmatimonadales bacterium]